MYYYEAVIIIFIKRYFYLAIGNNKYRRLMTNELVTTENQDQSMEASGNTDSYLLSSRILREIKRNGLSGLSKSDKLWLAALIVERSLGASLVFCQTVLTAGLPISNKFSDGYDRSSSENKIEFDNWLHSAAPLFFFSGTIANVLYTHVLFSCIEKELKNIKDLVTSRDYRKIVSEVVRYTFAFAAASYDSQNCHKGLEEHGISGAANEILGWLGHAAMTKIYKDSLTFDSKDWDNIKKCFFESGNSCHGFSPSLYGVLTFTIGAFRVIGMSGQMLSNIPKDLGYTSQIKEIVKITGASAAFAGLTAKSLAKLREPVCMFAMSVFNAPKKAIDYCTKPSSGYNDLEANVTANPANSSESRILLAIALGLALIAVATNAYGNAFLADNKSKTLINTFGMIAVALCSGVICGSGAPEIFGFKRAPGNTPSDTSAVAKGLTVQTNNPV
jgi:hypothetical protein